MAFDAPNFNDLFRIGRDEVLAGGSRLSLEAVERAGSDANVLLAAGAAAGDEVVAQLVEVEAGQFLASARGQQLDRLVFDRYGLLRKPAASALGTVVFSLPTAAASTFTIPSGTLLSTADGVQFVTTGVASFLEATTSVSVFCRSVLAGLAQQAQKNTITNIMGAIPSAPAGLTVTNPLATGGADDVEKDEALRDRARRFWTTARRGTKAALEAAATGVPGVQRATALDVIDASGRPARLVELIVSDAFTDALVDQGVNPPAYQAQSNALSNAVFAALDDVRPAGTYVQVLVAQAVLQGVKLQLRFNAGVDADLVALNARAVVVALINALAPGAPLLVQAIYDALELVPGLVFTGDEVTSPVADILPKPLQVLRTSLNLVTTAPASTEAPNALLSTYNPDNFLVTS
jgi:uncharacterized phage protein gp47/JayE